MMKCFNCGGEVWECVGDWSELYWRLRNWRQTYGEPMTSAAWERMLSDGWEIGE